MTSLGIEPVTFLLVAQCLNQLCALLTFCIGLVNFVCMCYVVYLGMFLVI